MYTNWGHLTTITYLIINKTLEYQENVNATEQNKIFSQRTQEQSGLNQDAAPFIPKETTTPVNFHSYNFHTPSARSHWDRHWTLP